jgi:hypothetical protein
MIDAHVSVQPVPVSLSRWPCFLLCGLAVLCIIVAASCTYACVVCGLASDICLWNEQSAHLC